MKTALKIAFILVIAILTVSFAEGQKPGKKITVTGYVKDETQASVANAIVLIDGKKTDFITDDKGFYKVKVKGGMHKIGILTTTNGILEEDMKGRTRINFTFAGTVPAQANPYKKADPGDDVIDVGYGKVRKRDLTTPVNKVDGTNPKYASYRTIYDMIRGEVPGVIVSGNKITVQGISSINLSTDPLFVVDGQTVSTIDDIQPYMVKSINVLKGSSASIYGSRGANGVILINLKGAGDN